MPSILEQARRWLSAGQRAGTPASGRKGDGTMATYEIELTDDEWRAKLTPAQYRVLRQAGTEPAWSGDLLHVDSDGVFHCAGCEAPLFSTSNKFESGTGWPSFDRGIAEGTILEHADRTFGMVRTEIICARCGGHLGHVFPDGPTDTGLRYCVNSQALTFDPEKPAASDQPE